MTIPHGINIRYPPVNKRVTYSESPQYARSESSIAINPANPYNIVASSKKFSDPSTYDFSLAVYCTFDGGETWQESKPLKLIDGWAGVSDPALAWDVSQSTSSSEIKTTTNPSTNEITVCTTTKTNIQNTVYLVALPFAPDDGPIIGIAVYQSTDGGLTWSDPNLIHVSVDPDTGREDDKQWAIGEYNPLSPYFGNVYAVWDDGPGVGYSKMAFARTIDHGKSWIGLKDKKAGSDIPGVEDSGSPEISVASDGSVYIVWLGNNNRDVKFVKSIDGGDTFSAPLVVAKDIVPLLYPYIENTHGWSHFPGATFRMGTYCTGCTTGDKIVVFAWADYREGISRIYYRRSIDGGLTWEGPVSGQPLLIKENVLSESDQQDFHPQLISTPTGEIGCAFYEFGPKGRSGNPIVWENSLINVIMAISVDDGKTFSTRITVTNYPWDPAVGAPLSHGDPDVTFIGEYFGLDASNLGFFPLWTDTRTGMQEIFTARINEIHYRFAGRNSSIIPSISEKD